MDRSVYDSLRLTVALHPSETAERLWARVLAYCLNAEPDLVFTRGLSEASEPDLWVLAGDGRPELWIEVGEPTVERMKKAAGRAGAVRLYCFNSKAATWWAQHEAALRALPVSVQRFEWPSMQALAALLTRTMELSVTISDGSIYVATESGEVELSVTTLAEA
jgi:uncharacterized protein YaeQ